MTASDPARIGELLDRAIEAVNKGDLTTAHNLAELVLLEDSENRDAAELLATEGPGSGELRRLTILCCDLVGSTELSERTDPERYRTLVRRYQVLAREVIEGRYEGHIVSVKGDGFLALFGYPSAHEDDTRRAVQAAFDLCHAIDDLSQQAQRAFGEPLDVRVGVHRGLVFIDTEEDDVFGLAANLASRVEGLAEPGTVVVTDQVRALVKDSFELKPGDSRSVKGVTEPVMPYTVVRELDARSGAHTTPLIGRASDLAVLRSAWAAARDCMELRSPSVLIRGEPGIGKSRLVAELIDEVGLEGGVVVELAGSQFYVGAGLHPIQLLLESQCGIGRHTDATERLRRLRETVVASGADGDTVVPLLAPILGLPPSAGYEAVAVEGRKLNEDITAAVYDFLTGCFQEHAGMLVVEDLQWLDESTITLLARVLAGGPPNVLVVMTTRDASPLSAGTVIELQPLAPHECMQLLEVLKPQDLSQDECKRLVDRSDGVPLYLEELARGWRSGSPDEQRVDGPDEIPDALYEPLVARLLSITNGVAVAGACATVGHPVDRYTLSALVDLTASETNEALDALVAANLLVAPGGADEAYQFRHELVRCVAYDLQPPALRRFVHGRIADLLVLGADAGDVVDWSIAASHYEQGRRPRDAVDAYAQAADRARRRGALAEARTQLGRSIELIIQLPDGPDRATREASLRLRRGFLAMSAEGAGSAEAASDYARCLELAMGNAQGDEMFSSLISLWAYHLSRAELDRSRDVLEALRSELDGPRASFRPANRAGFGMISWFEGDFVTAREILESAVADVNRIGRDSSVDELWFVPNDPTTAMHTHLALARFMCGDFEGADREMTRSASLATQLDFPQGPWSAAYGTWLRSWMLAERGEYELASQHVAAMMDSSMRHGFDSWTMIAMTQQAAIDAMRALATGCDAQAAATHAGALEGLVGMWQAVELRVFLPYYLTILGAAVAAVGDLGEARRRYEDARILADSTGMQFYAVETSRRAAHLAANRGAVIDELRSALQLARSTGARPFELRTALDLCALDAEDSLLLLDEAARGFLPSASSADLETARARSTATR